MPEHLPYVLRTANCGIKQPRERRSTSFELVVVIVERSGLKMYSKFMSFWEVVVAFSFVGFVPVLESGRSVRNKVMSWSKSYVTG